MEALSPSSTFTSQACCHFGTFLQKPHFRSKNFTGVLNVSKTVLECVQSQHQWWSELTSLSLRYLCCFDQGLTQDTWFHEIPLLSLLPITSNLPDYDCLGTEAPGRANELVQKLLLSKQNMLRRYASSECLNSFDGIHKSGDSFSILANSWRCFLKVS